MGREAPELSRIAVPEVSPRATAVDQVPPTPRPLKMTRNPAVDPSPPMRKSMLPVMTSMQICDAEVLSDSQAASDGNEGPGRTPT